MTFDTPKVTYLSYVIKIWAASVNVSQSFQQTADCSNSIVTKVIRCLGEGTREKPLVSLIVVVQSFKKQKCQLAVLKFDKSMFVATYVTINLLN